MQQVGRWGGRLRVCSWWVVRRSGNLPAAAAAPPPPQLSVSIALQVQMCHLDPEASAVAVRSPVARQCRSRVLQPRWTCAALLKGVPAVSVVVRESSITGPPLPARQVRRQHAGAAEPQQPAPGCSGGRGTGAAGRLAAPGRPQHPRAAGGTIFAHPQANQPPHHPQDNAFPCHPASRGTQHNPASHVPRWSTHDHVSCRK
jgi:hypothetical protein